ncbi:MAG: TonB-dependent receptor [Bacteroidetes bacterium]|nr:MAG: TonB-dependent receptor [Bacteroidota bacterium]
MKYYFFNHRFYFFKYCGSVFVFAYLIIVFSAIVYSQNKNEKDSVKTKFPEIVVTASRLNKSPGTEFSAYSTITKSELTKIGAVQISDVLQFIPGVFIKNYGGMGGFKNLSIRGTTAKQTILMIDGVRINSTQNGMCDLSIIPVDMVNEIEIIRGGNSVLFGANAIGGIVNLITRSSDSISFFKGNLKYGSYDDFHSAFNSRIISSAIDIDGSLEYLSSKGNYKFKVIDFGERKILHRENADFENLSVSLSFNSKPSDLNYSIKGIGRISDRGTPGAVTQNNVENAFARLKEKELIILGSSSLIINDDQIINLTSLFRVNDYLYNDPLLKWYSPTGLDEIFINRDFQLSTKYSYKIQKFLADINIEGGYSDIRGNMLQPGVGNYKKRNSFGISGLLENSFGIYNESYITCQLGLRADVFSDAGNAISPLVGLIFNAGSLPLKFRFNYAYNFRPPNFNEMYYLNYGTSNLIPERSHSFNLGLSSWIISNTTIEIETFLISTKNQIISVPNSPIQWSARNYGEVQTKGLEIRLQSSLFDKTFNFQLVYTLQEAIDKSPDSITFGMLIPYVPQELIAGSFDYNYAGFILGLNFQYSSYYYTIPGNSLNNLMPSYTILNVFISKNFELLGTNLELRIDCNNIFNAQYCVVWKYPMPGRLLKGGISIKI